MSKKQDCDNRLPSKKNFEAYEEIHIPDKEEIKGKRDPNRKKKKHLDRNDYESNWN